MRHLRKNSFDEVQNEPNAYESLSPVEKDILLRAMSERNRQLHGNKRNYNSLYRSGKMKKKDSWLVEHA